MKLYYTQEQQLEEELHLVAVTEDERLALRTFWSKLQKGSRQHGSYSRALEFAEILEDNDATYEDEEDRVERP